METITEKTTVKNGGKEKPIIPVNERIQLARFWARLVIGLLSLALFGYIVHSMLTLQSELTQSSRDLLNILLGSFISIISGIATYYYSNGDDIIHPPDNGGNPSTFEQKVELTSPNQIKGD